MNKKTRNIIIGIAIVIVGIVIADNYNDKVNHPYKDNVNVGEWYSESGDYCDANYNRIGDIENYDTSEDIDINLSDDGTGYIDYYNYHSKLTWTPINETDDDAYGVIINPQNSNIPITKLSYSSEYDEPHLIVNACGEYEDSSTAYIKYNLAKSDE